MKKLLCILLLSLVALSSTFAQAKPVKKIPMLFGAKYEPFYIPVLDASGKQIGLKGMLIDFFEEFQRAYPQYKIEVIWDLPRKRMNVMMDTGEALAIAINNPMFAGEKAGNFIWSDSIFYTKDIVISPIGAPIRYTKPEDLFGKSIAKILGNGYGPLDKLFADGKITAMDLANWEWPKVLELMRLKRVDGCFANIHAARYAFAQAKINQADYFWAETPLFGFDLQCQINKGEVQFQADLNAFIAKCKANGFLTKLEDKWLK